MDYREEAFRTKFDHASKQLGVAPGEVVSIKLRDNVGNHHEYQQLLDALTQDGGLKQTPAGDGLQGTGHIIGNTTTKVIVVEHETGLEILYIAGSVASLIGLVPLVLKCWTAIRGHMGHRPHHHSLDGVEIRKLGDDGKLVEDRSHGMMAPWGYGLLPVDKVLLLAAEKIETELCSLRAQVETLTTRVKTLEKKKSSTARSSRKSSGGKKRSK